MSDQEQKFGEASVQSDQGLAPMPDSFAAPDDDRKKKTYNAEQDGLKAAAAEVVEAREAKAPPTTDKTRVYQNLATGEQIPENLTISAEKAGRDVGIMREVEALREQPQPDLDKLQNVVDGMRQTFPNKELPPDFIPQVQQYAEQAKQQQSQLQEQQPQVDAQPQPQPQDGIDPDIAQALQNPKIRQALEAEVMAAENARVQYANATAQAAQLAGASLLASFPELANVPTNQLQTAIQVIGVRDPQRAQAINAQLERTQALMGAAQQAQHAQAQIQAQRAAVEQQQLQRWFTEQDAEFDRQVTSKETPESMRKLAEDVVALAGEYGIGKEQLAELWQSQPLMRSAPFQRMMVDAAKYRAAQRAVVNKIDRSAVPVQRPGVSQRVAMTTSQPH